MKKPLVYVSACLLGISVRYDNGHSRDPLIAGVIARLFDLKAVCPETEAGLPTPRPPMRLAGDPRDPSLLTINTGNDVTLLMKGWMKTKAEEFLINPPCGFILKSKSPSCGTAGVRVFDEKGRAKANGAGIFAAALIVRFPDVPITDEIALSDPALLEEFVENVFARFELE